MRLLPGVMERDISAFNSHTEEKSGVMSLDHKLNGSKYPAVKSDDTGVVDDAFTETEDGPEWLLNTDIASAEHGMSRVRYANVQDLIIISDVWNFLFPLLKLSDTPTLILVLEVLSHYAI